MLAYTLTRKSHYVTISQLFIYISLYSMSKKGISDADNLLPEPYEYTKDPDNGRMNSWA